MIGEFDGIVIREAKADDEEAILEVHRKAFGGKDEANLVQSILEDETAGPVLSLVAANGQALVGHVLYSGVTIGMAEGIKGALLCPLSVVPELQRQGVGGRLVQEGLEHLRRSGVDLVFVLGHPDYYPRHGFVPAGPRGLQAPYPIKEKNSGAWLVHVLSGTGAADKVQGTVRVAQALNKPEYWAEPEDSSA